MRSNWRAGKLFERMPAHALNGVSVALGVGLVQLLVGSVASTSFAQAASTGAVLASLAHLTHRADVTLRRTLVGGGLGTLAGLVVAGTGEHAWLRASSIGVVSFAALLGMAWGPRAGPLVFSAIIGVVFSLALPAGARPLEIALAGCVGFTLYSAWAWLSNRLLERRYRALAATEAVRAAAALLRARAAVLSQAHPLPASDSEARFEQLQEEVRLAQALQNARDLLYPASSNPDMAMQAALLLRVAEIREIVLTSRLDLDLLGHDHAARFVRARLALGLRVLSEELGQLGQALQSGESSSARLEPARALPDLLEARTIVAEDDPRLGLLPTVALRLRYLNEEVQGIRALLLGGRSGASVPPEDLAGMVVENERWPLAIVLENCTPSSPVFRHALRSALAFVAVYSLAQALPWTTRPYWLLLSVAVVLRGTLDDTLTRRNARIGGTALGCVLITLLIPALPDSALKLVFVGAVGVAHAFVNVRYLLTAISATAMALLQAHFSAPHVTPLVIERLLDTVLGALFAWAFSYVLPSWERRTLPDALARALESLRTYARSALTPGGTSGEQRLHRQRAYDALAVIAAALRRSAAEPPRVRPPVADLVSALDHAQRLMAHLSSLRSLLRRRAESLPSAETNAALAATRHSVQEALSVDFRGEAAESRVPSFSELPVVPAEREPLPWLLRRLDASIHDASEAGRAARRAIASLALRQLVNQEQPGSSDDEEGQRVIHVRESK
jgi:uncharacterized membrane protein YccC